MLSRGGRSPVEHRQAERQPSGGASGSPILPLAQEQIKGPATAGVGAGAAEVAEDRRGCAASILQGVSEHAQAGDAQVAARQQAFLVCSPGEREDSRGQPTRVEYDGAKRAPEDLSDECRLSRFLCLGY